MVWVCFKHDKENFLGLWIWMIYCMDHVFEFLDLQDHFLKGVRELAYF